MEVRVECYPDHGVAGGSDQVLGACNRQYTSMHVPAIFFFCLYGIRWYQIVVYLITISEASLLAKLHPF